MSAIESSLPKAGLQASKRAQERPGAGTFARHSTKAGSRWPEHEAAFRYAVGEGASLVARGVVPIEAVQESLVIWVGGPECGTRLRCEIAWALRAAVRELKLGPLIAEERACRAMAPLLDSRQPLEIVQQAAAAADPDGLLSSVELNDLVATEAAWWARLHTDLGVLHGA